ncbi:D-alanyl-D-alanine carboxypeptidase, partial [Streptomyces sp. MCAF7]
MPTSSRAPKRRTAAPLAASAALLLAAMLSAAPAHAAAPTADRDDDTPKPPAKMSDVGGERLGRAGTQVSLKGGAPALPKGLSGLSWMVADAESGDVLAAHNAHW